MCLFTGKAEERLGAGEEKRRNGLNFFGIIIILSMFIN